MIDTPTKAIEALWKEGFFKQAKTVEEIRKRLAADGFNFENPALMMALKRSKQLTRGGNKGGYTYIQKYPAQQGES